MAVCSVNIAAFVDDGCLLFLCSRGQVWWRGLFVSKVAGVDQDRRMTTALCLIEGSMMYPTA